jgi:hypothetical protein
MRQRGRAHPGNPSYSGRTESAGGGVVEAVVRCDDDRTSGLPPGWWVG